jgi:DNA repair protein RecO (recombination protein O)
VVCASCEGEGFPLSEETHRFMVEALARPLAEAPLAERGVTSQADRAVTETLEHHAHVRLRAAA